MNKYATLYAYCAAAETESASAGGLGGETLSIQERVESTFSQNYGAGATQPTGDGDDSGISDNQQKKPVQNVDVEDDQHDDDDYDDGSNDDDDDDQSELDPAVVANILGVDASAIGSDAEGNLVFNAVINGEKQPVKFQDLVKSYQLEGHVNQKSMKLENERKEFEALRDEAYNAAAQRIEIANSLVNTMEQNLLQEFNAINWDALRAEDPAEWAAARQYYQERAAQVQNIKNDITNKKTDNDEQQNQVNMQRRQQFIAGELQKLIEQNPTWSDQNVMQAEMTAVGKFAADTYGFSAEEVASVFDARLFNLLADAQKYHGHKAAIDQKRAKKQNPTFKPQGATQAAKPTEAAIQKAKLKRVRESGGSLDSVADLIKSRL